MKCLMSVVLPIPEIPKMEIKRVLGFSIHAYRVDSSLFLP